MNLVDTQTSRETCDHLHQAHPATMSGFIHNTNLKIAKTVVGKYFRLDGSGHVRSILSFNTYYEY